MAKVNQQRLSEILGSTMEEVEPHHGRIESLADAQAALAKIRSKPLKPKKKPSEDRGASPDSE